tara:strand:+ start:4976 stop:5152 length:177 start_codon:yes stop_codon:yes gene_type:complete
MSGSPLVLTLVDEPISGMHVGVGVYKHPKKVIVKDLTKKERKKYWIGWYGKLTDKCVC